MDQETLLSLLEEYPVIPAVKNEAGLRRCAESDNPLVFVLHGTVNTIPQIVNSLKAHGKTVFVHMDLLEGLAQKEAAVEFLAKNTQADGVISTRPNLVRCAAALGLMTVQRFFLLDSMSLQNVLKADSQDSANLIEVLPGLMPKVIRQLTGTLRTPLITGGLITDKEDVYSALTAGAAAISTTNEAVWFL